MLFDMRFTRPFWSYAPQISTIFTVIESQKALMRKKDNKTEKKRWSRTLQIYCGGVLVISCV